MDLSTQNMLSSCNLSHVGVNRTPGTEQIISILVHLLADLLIALRGDEHLDTGLIHVVDIGPVSLDLGVFNPTGQAINGPCSSVDHKHKIVTAGAGLC